MKPKDRVKLLSTGDKGQIATIIRVFEQEPDSKTPAYAWVKFDNGSITQLFLEDLELVEP